MNQQRIKQIWIFGIGLCLLGFLIFLLRLPQIPDDLNKIAISKPTYIYAANGQVIKALTNRDPIPIQSVSPHFLNAIITLEDGGFYKHHGISKKGILRALVNNIKSLRISGGGSTITQQLVKNLYFSFDKTMLRKAKELMLTLQIERQFSKEEILEAYVNQINFGSGIYGVELASQIYFGKHADELTLPEAALLAGIPNYPARYNPYIHLDIAKQRRNFVLLRMAQNGYISEKDYQYAIGADIKLEQLNKYYSSAEYFTEHLLNQLETKYGQSAVNYGGFNIHTTLNPQYQYQATLAVKQGLEQLDKLIGLEPYEKVSWEEKLKYPQAAMVAIDPMTGAVRAMVGGRDFRRSPYNRAAANNRHVGSTIKPIIYFTALDQQVATPESIYKDEPVSFKISKNQTWKPENWDNKFLGPMTLKYALVQSRNTVSAQLVDKLTPKKVIQTAQNMGITSPMQEHLSLALGAVGVSPLEMASVYAVIASQGRKNAPYFLEKITSNDNKLIEEHQVNTQKIYDEQTFYQLIDMMKDVMTIGTGRSIKRMHFDLPCAGKTGTTDDFRDAWFIGFTPNLVAAVWVGFDDNRSMRRKNGNAGIAGATAALPIWARFMLNVYYNQTYSDFTIPPGIVFKNVDAKTGSVPGPGSEVIQVALKR